MPSLITGSSSLPVSRRVNSELGTLLQEKIARQAIADPFYWLTEATRTKDEQDALNPYKPFPKKQYLLLALNLLLDPREEQVNVYKSRTMMLSWLVSGLATHLACTVPATKIVFQSEDEERSVHDVANCKVLWQQSIPRLKQKWPLLKSFDSQPFNKLMFKNGSEIIGIPGDPRKIKSEHPTVYIQDESAIMKEGSDAFNEAVATRCKKIICISSAFPGWYADLVEAGLFSPWPDYIQSKIGRDVIITQDKIPASFRPAPYSPYPGVMFKRTINKAAILDLDITADPEFRNNPERIEALKAKFTPEAYYNREIKRQAYALSGATVYPEFNPEVHVVPHQQVPTEGCIFMALDPHPRTPHASLWVLIDKWNDWWVYRELWPSKVYGRPGKLADEDSDKHYSIREYVETVAWLEGNSIKWQHAESDREYGSYTVSLDGEKVVSRYMDQAGRGFIASEVQNETYSTRYRKFGLSFRDPRKDHDIGEDAVRTLLKPRRHDTKGMWPRLHISDQCPELILEIQRHRYRMMRKQVEEKELTQDRSTFRCHLVDCLRYLAVSPILYIARDASLRFDRATLSQR